MATVPVQSSGLSSFQSDQPSSTGAGPSGSVSDSSGDQSGSGNDSVRRMSLRSLVEGRKKIELQNQGKELVNFKMVSSDFKVEDLVGSDTSSEGLKAIMITRSEDNPQDFQVQLLRVRPNGSTTTLFNSDGVDPIAGSSDSGNLDLRGSLLDATR
jgi:hypothetical protein